jgi:hypothetical protein
VPLLVSVVVLLVFFLFLFAVAGVRALLALLPPPNLVRHARLGSASKPTTTRWPPHY